MVTVTAVLDASGLLKSCNIKGHAGAGKRGNDVVCAAVSVLARTAQIVLSNRNGIIIRSKALRRGVFTLKTEAQDNSGKDYLAAIGTFLLEGLHSVAEEYPENCVITIKNERRN